MLRTLLILPKQMSKLRCAHLFNALVLSACVLAGSGVVATPMPPLKTLTYRVRTPVLSKTCENEATDLGSRFAKATQLKVTKAECLGVVTSPQDSAIHLNVLVVTYLADAEVQPYAALFGYPGSERSGTPDIYEGIYPSYATCIADLPKQAANFERFTGLIAVDASCEAGKASASTFVLTIHGFGKPGARLYTLRGFSEGVVRDKYDQIQALLLQGGANIVKEITGSYHYYAAKPVGLYHDRIAFFRVDAECSSQLTEFEAIARKAGANFVIAACPTSPIGSGVFLESMSDSTALILNDYGRNSTDYFSFAECLQDKERMINQVVAKGVRPLGGLCQADSLSGGYKLNLYMRY